MLFTLLLVGEHTDPDKRLKYTLQTCSQGTSNSRRLKAGADEPPDPGQPLPDPLLLDSHLPPDTAVEVLRWIQQQPHLGVLPVRVCSCLPYGPQAEACLALGARSYPPKPKPSLR